LRAALRDPEKSWEYFRRTDLHKLAAVDATSYSIMNRARIRLAFAANLCPDSAAGSHSRQA